MAAEFFEFEKKLSDGIRRKSQRAMLRKAVPEIKRVEHIELVAAHEKKPEGEDKILNIRNMYEVDQDGSSDVSIREVLQETVSPSITHFVKQPNSPTGRDESLSLPEEIRKDKKSRMVRWGGIAGIGFLTIAAIALSLYFPRLTVKITPALHPHELSDTKLILNHAVSELRLDRNTIPAERLEFSGTEKVEFAGSDQKYIETKAYGTVKIYNNFSTAPQNLVASTRFFTDAGVLYRLPKPVIIPGAAMENGKLSPRFVEVELFADQKGEGGNLSGEAVLKIPGFQGTPRYGGFYAVAKNGFKGGFKGESKTAAKADIISAEENATKKVYDKLKQGIAQGTPPDFKALDGLREIEIMGITGPHENEPGARFEVEARAQARVLVFREVDLVSLLEQALVEILQDRERLDTSKLGEVRFIIKEVDFEKGIAEIALQGKVYGKSVIPHDELALVLAGKTKESALELLRSRDDLEDFTLELFPFWRRSIPRDASQIKIKVEE